MRFVFRTFILLTYLVFSGYAHAGSLTVPNTFTAGTPAKASEVNANFSSTKAAVDDNHNRITTLEAVAPCLADGTNCAKQGVIYTNWGRNDCPQGAAVVYSGYIAGKSYMHTGGGSNLLCLTDTPVDPVSHSDLNQNGALVYGAEFNTQPFGVAALQSVHGQDPLCAICMVDTASMQLMVPGSTACPNGWNKQYDGYLMSSHYTQSSSEFVCVNSTPLTRPGSGAQAGNGSALLYPAETECGALPCAPYTQDREISCSVCTR